MYKLVDDFNGWEGEQRFEKLVDACQALDEKVDEYREYHGTDKACRFVVVAACSDWHFYHQKNKWIWG